VIKSSGPYAGSVTTCDEFPFRSTAEGGSAGNGAWISCIDETENDEQGMYLRSWYSQNVGPGDQFIVKVIGLNCSTVSPSDLQGCGGAVRMVRARNEGREVGIEGLVRHERMKRDSFNNNSASGATNSVYKSWDNTTNIVVVPFGDLDGGTFSANARLVSGNLNDISVIDNDGNTILQPASLNALYSDQGISLNWSSDGYVSGVGIVGSTNESIVNLTYSFVINGTSPSTSRGVSLKVMLKSIGAALEHLGWSLMFIACGLAWLL